MGEPKQHVGVDGVTMGEHAIELARRCCDLVVVSGPPGAMPGMEHISDRPAHAGCGPLAGIEAVLASGRAERWLVLPCDMPFLRVESLERLLASTADVAAFQDPAQPSTPLQLPLAIRASMHASTTARLNINRRSVQGWLDTVDVECVAALDDREAKNINYL